MSRLLLLLSITSLFLSSSCVAPDWDLSVTVRNASLDVRFVNSAESVPWITMLRPMGEQWSNFYFSEGDCSTACETRSPTGEVLSLQPGEQITVNLNGVACAHLATQDLRGDCAALHDLDPMVAASARYSAIALAPDGSELGEDLSGVQAGDPIGDVENSVVVFTLPAETDITLDIP